MLEQVTLQQLLVWLLVGGGLSILIERVWPGWPTWQSKLKPVIVFLLNYVGQFALSYIQMSPEISGYLEQTLANLIFAMFTAMAGFVVHKLDELLAAKVMYERTQIRELESFIAKPA